METTKPSHYLRMALVLVAFSFAGCATISSFDQYAYIQSTSLKVDALNMMDLAQNNFSTNEKAVLEFQTKMQKAYEYEKNRPKNEITVRQWDLLMDTTGHLLGGFIERWKKEQKLNSAYITEKKKQVSTAFDLISGLESKKINPTNISQ
jgi:hypothetical protein